ncbi:response regulator transcription factor [Lentzea sp. NPDC003310]|uniref:helix-turn-helix transcriptional regulator n=1 Tax=Lentzea sp. NPDC003310 TaxID=3154447 RepID=UPI0033A42D9D
MNQVVVPPQRTQAKAILVAPLATDELTLAGLKVLLAQRPEVRIAPEQNAQVLVFAAHRLDNRTTPMLRAATSTAGSPVVLLLDDLAESQLLLAVECQVQAILPQSTLTPERLARAVTAVAAGEGVLPPSLVGDLLGHVRRLLVEAGLNAAGLSPREVEVARLLSAGMENGEVAAELGLSERTVKSVVHTITRRLNLRNRAHVVAHAMRFGLI